MSTPSKLFELNQFNTNPRSYGRQGGGGEAVGAEAVVVANEEGGDAKAGVKDVAEVLLGREGGEGAGEVEDFYVVDAEGGEHGFSLLEGRQEAQFPRTVLEDGPGVRPERDDERLVSALTRQGDESLDHEAVSGVDAVEKACCGNHRFLRFARNDKNVARCDLRSTSRTRNPDDAAGAGAWRRCGRRPGRRRWCRASRRRRSGRHRPETQSVGAH